ncbi:hypothetical protein [Alkalihalobacterium bogoriense]|uniref:hypothetical protein n=1 Tax=Alkalihalobacterium bogoriense TaxID=246272 RepID=UPI00047A0074|nr:hypothetical protein [Alkalihalobacterium bogoriense]
MKKGKFLLFIFVVFLTGCFGEIFSFTGEGEYWTAEVVINQVSGKESESIILQYKGEDIESFEDFEFIIESSLWGLGVEGAKLNKEGMFVQEDSSSNDKKTRKDSPMSITFKWDGKTESFQLVTEK